MKILKDSLIYLFGELIAKALPFLLLPYLTRKFGSAGFGELSYYQTIGSLLIIVFALSQDGALTRYFYVYGKRNLHNIMLSGYIYTLFCIIIALLYAWFSQSIVLAAVIAAAAAQSILSVQLAWRQCQKYAVSYTLIQIASGVLTSLLTVVFLESSDHISPTPRFAALFIGNIIISLIAYYFAQPKRIAKKGSLKILKLSGCYIIAFGAPLLLHHTSGFIKGQLDRIVIYQHYPAEQLGIYAAAYQVASILSILLLAINKATVPHYYQAIKQGSLNATKVRQFARYSLIIAPLPAFITYMLPEKLFLWLLGATYGGVQHYICLFLIGFGLTIPYYLLVNYLFYYGKNKLIASISLLSTGAYLLALFATTLLGIAWIPLAMIIGNIVILPILFYYVREEKAA
ncbi:oligosaccharide flippase family protein [Wielerella bovis]|uniref:oligosaccharide flippase family protein n=1 Tax=Wielerella bovis TaxID=2917790 RepID=UPI002019D58B|nr:oligosaccharide flippase family protein [Wielerella bovis]ULJ62191.1 oligosaccharide flippase family protein [Wielerella bovis]